MVKAEMNELYTNFTKPHPFLSYDKIQSDSEKDGLPTLTENNELSRLWVIRLVKQSDEKYLVIIGFVVTCALIRSYIESFTKLPSLICDARITPKAKIPVRAKMYDIF